MNNDKDPKFFQGLFTFFLSELTGSSAFRMPKSIPSPVFTVESLYKF